MIDKLIEKLPRWAKAPAEILVEASEEYGLDRAGRMAAAIAYRTVFALAPLLIIAVSVLGAVLGSSEEARDQILEAVSSVAGPQIEEVMVSFLDSALDAGTTSAVVGGALLFWTASSLFLEMQHDLNDIFDVPYEQISGVLAVARTRGIGFLWALGLGLGLIAIWLLNTVWRFLGNLLPPTMDSMHEVITYLAPLASLVLLPLLFGLIFQTMTAVFIPWRAVWVGGLFTAVVFLAASYGIGLFFAIGASPTALGFAGSFVVIIFLAYFLSSVFLFGAEVTRVYADRLEQRGQAPAVARFSSDPQVLVAQPPGGVPQSAFLAFLAGLLIGWRRSRR